MKIAVMGDIHSNIEALNSVLKDVESQNIKRILCTGDLTGYFYHPDECIEIIRKLCPETVQGNHDYWETIGIDASKKSKLTAENKLFLQGLPKKDEIVIDGKRILLCHGSPRSQMEYIYPDASLNKLRHCSVKGADIVCIGHTHYPFIKMMKTTRRQYLIVNPGSVGQPRDGGMPSWCLLDVENMKAEIRRVKYDINKLLKEVQKNDPRDLYLSMVLRRCTYKGVI